MRDKIYTYLQQRPAGASVEELLDLMFTYPGADPELRPYLVQLLLEPDPRFVWDPHLQRWKLREFATFGQAVDDATFVVVDIETTGLTPDADGIMEIGAVRVERGRIVGRFEQLVRPSKRPPPFIVHLTGITWAMLRDQPALAEVWPDFVAFVRDGVLVAHNASFDLSYLNLASRIFSGAPLAETYLCTLKLARRLVPETRRRGLDSLAELFGLRLEGRHRALGDALITTEILFHLLERAKQRGLHRVDQILALQHEGRDGRPFFCPLPRAVVEQLPNTPGIYRFYNQANELLYIGRAKDLRRRVSSYLSNSEHHSPKTLDLIRHIHSVSVEQCPSELEAALREAEEIRRAKPPYNQRSKHLPQIAYLKIGRERDFPRISITSRPAGPAQLLIGPLRSRHEAERLLKIWLRIYGLRTCRGELVPVPEATPCFQGQTGLCAVPCAARIEPGAYQARVQALLDDIASNGEATRNYLLAERDRLAQLERFEAAQRAHEDFVFFERLCARFRVLGWLNSEQNFLLLLPEEHRAALRAYVVLGGELVARTVIFHGSELESWMLRCALDSPCPKRQFDRVDASVILAAWLRDRRVNSGVLLRLPKANTTWPATLMEEWRATCEQLLAAPQLTPSA